jgi:hypothetical protein
VSSTALPRSRAAGRLCDLEHASARAARPLIPLIRHSSWDSYRAPAPSKILNAIRQYACSSAGGAQNRKLCAGISAATFQGRARPGLGLGPALGLQTLQDPDGVPVTAIRRCTRGRSSRHSLSSYGKRLCLKVISLGFAGVCGRARAWSMAALAPDRVRESCCSTLSRFSCWLVAVGNEQFLIDEALPRRVTLAGRGRG